MAQRSIDYKAEKLLFLVVHPGFCDLWSLKTVRSKQDLASQTSYRPKSYKTEPESMPEPRLVVWISAASGSIISFSKAFSLNHLYNIQVT